MKSVKCIKYARLIKINMFNKDDDYLRHNKKNLSLTFHIQLSKNAKNILLRFYLQSTLNIEHFQKMCLTA